MWERVLPHLEERGLPAYAVDLPSCGSSAGTDTGLRADETAVREVVDGIDGEVVLCGHSYGGMVVTGAAYGTSNVRRLVYVCGFMPVEGQSLLGTFDGVVPGFWRIRDDLTVVARPDEGLLRASGLTAEDQALLAARRVPQSLTAYTETPTGIGWRSIPSTYAVCTEDAQFPVELQRSLSLQATDVVELPTAHHPMLVRPGLVAAMLARYAQDG